jgi:hydrogenase maturation protein HypF
MTQAALRALALARSLPPVLAVGAWFKNTVCVTRGDEAFLSASVGDLADAAACRAFEAAVDDMLASLQVAPQGVAHDLHPDFHSTRFALEFADRRGLPAIGVQHHHAHIAAVAAEHGVNGRLLGLALDGVGLGTDGNAWGGELLDVDGARSRRLGHLRPLALPGGDRAAREPWRMALAALYALGRFDVIARRYPDARGSTLLQMLDRGVNCPATSSAGRVFDAAAGLLGVCAQQTFEGEAPMLLERLAARHGSVAPLDDGYVIDAAGCLDLLPLLARMADVDPNDADAVGRAAAEFHATLAAALADWVRTRAASADIGRVAFGGGCFHNRVLGTALRARLEADGLTVLEATRLPPSDSGVALGQAWVAAQRLH